MITPCDVIGIVDVRVCAQLSFIAFLCTGHQADSLSWALIGHLLGNDVILRGEQYWSMRLYISDYSWYCVRGGVVCMHTCTRAFVHTFLCGSTVMLLSKAVVAAVQAFYKQVTTNAS